MARIPERVLSAWKTREGPVVFATTGPGGVPNTIYATCVNLHGDDTIVVADNYFQKTRENILAGSPGAVLFLTPDKKSYQVKGRLRYHTEGEIYDEMKRWNPQKHPGHAAAALSVEEIYCGSERII